MEDKIPIYTDLIITPKSEQSLRRYFNSIKRNLPKGWQVDKTPYSDNDTFIIRVWKSYRRKTSQWGDLVKA